MKLHRFIFVIMLSTSLVKGMGLEEDIRRSLDIVINGDRVAIPADVVQRWQILQDASKDLDAKEVKLPKEFLQKYKISNKEAVNLLKLLVTISQLSEESNIIKTVINAGLHGHELVSLVRLSSYLVARNMQDKSFDEILVSNFAALCLNAQDCADMLLSDIGGNIFAPISGMQEKRLKQILLQVFDKSKTCKINPQDFAQYDVDHMEIMWSQYGDYLIVFTKAVHHEPIMLIYQRALNGSLRLIHTVEGGQFSPLAIYLEIKETKPQFIKYEDEGPQQGEIVAQDHQGNFVIVSTRRRHRAVWRNMLVMLRRTNHGFEPIFSYVPKNPQFNFSDTIMSGLNTNIDGKNLQLYRYQQNMWKVIQEIRLDYKDFKYIWIPGVNEIIALGDGKDLLIYKQNAQGAFYEAQKINVNPAQTFVLNPDNVTLVLANNELQMFQFFPDLHDLSINQLLLLFLINNGSLRRSLLRDPRFPKILMSYPKRLHNMFLRGLKIEELQAGIPTDKIEEFFAQKAREESQTKLEREQSYRSKPPASEIKDIVASQKIASLKPLRKP